MLTKENKTKQIEKFSSNFKKAKAHFIVQFKGLSVVQMTDLRFQLRKNQAAIQVIRNTLSKRVVGESPEFKEIVNSSLSGANAFVFSFGEASQTAKVLYEFAEDTNLEIKNGILNQQIFSAQQVEQLAKLPSQDELRAQLLSLLSTPARQFVCLMSQIPSSCVRVLQSRVDQKNITN